MHRFAVSGRSRSPHRCVRYIALTNQPMTDRDPTLPGAEAQSDHDTLCAYQGGGVSGGIVAERGVWVGSYVDQFCIAAAA